MNRLFLEELGLSKEQIDAIFREHGKSIADLKSRVATAESEREEVKKQLEQTQTDLETKYQNEQKEFAIKYALKDSNAHDSNLVLGLLDRDSINIEDGEISGLNEQVEALKESKGFLFKQQEPEVKEEVPKPNFLAPGNPIGGQLGVEKDAFSNTIGKYQ